MIEKVHSIVLTEIFDSQEAFNAHESECEFYRSEWQTILSELSDTTVTGCGFSTFVPHIQFFTFDALNSRDWPNGIAQNSIFVMFKVDMRAHTIEVESCGHIWLTDNDVKKSCLVMCSIKQAHKANGGVWMRKSKYSNAQNLANKAKTFWNDVVKTLNDVTGGYPYKQMTVDIY